MPDAPKGGMFSQLVGSGGSTFNSLNAFIVKGDRANGMELTFASLMARAFDEPDAVYLLAAEELTVSPDGLVFRFQLRPGITFHDGSEITASDVAFSLMTLKARDTLRTASVLRDLADATVEDKRTVQLRFQPTRGLDVPALAAAMPIFSEKYYSTRPFDETSLEAPLGSGPYRVARFEQGRYVEFERVKNWWGENLPVCRGLYNFDTLRDEYYRDREAGFEAFTGRNYLFREEFTSRVWATRYDFPAIRDGRVKRDVIPDERPSGAQGWLLNTRRDKFKDRRVREALTIAFDFEWTNKNLMYGSYQRTHSVFQNSDMMARGEPSPEEIALLEPFRDRLLPEVFGPAWIPAGDRRVRAGSQAAAQRRRVAQCRRLDGQGRPPVKCQGRTVIREFLLTERSFEPHHQTFIKNLRVLGIEANIRLVDPAQAEERQKDFDFDIAIARFIFPQIPGSSLRNYFSSDSAKTKGSNNLAGIDDPVVDALVDKAVAAQTQAALTTPAARSIACCAPAATGFRTGTRLRTGSPIGTSSVSRRPSPAMPAARRIPGGTTGQGRQTRAGEIVHDRLYRPPHSADDPDTARHPVRLLRGRAVRARRAGRARDRAALGCRYRRRPRAYRAPPAAISVRDPRSAHRPTPSVRNTAARRGSIRNSSRSSRRNSDSTSRRRSAFALMVWNFARFDFGKSYFRDVSVIQLIKEKLPVSMSLGIWMTLLTYLISIPLGIRKAVQDGSKFDTWTSAVIIVGFAIPGFLFAILLIILFAGGSFFNIFPLRGLTSDGWAQFPWYWKIIDYFWHLTLPLISMALGAFATMTLLTKNSFLDEIRKQYVMTARAKGCSERQVLYNHIFRNAMLIVIAGFPGAFIHAFFSGSLLIETIFSLDGLGLLGFESVLNRDYPVVFGTLFIFSLVGLVINLVSDLAYMWIDPRIDFEAREV